MGMIMIMMGDMVMMQYLSLENVHGDIGGNIQKPLLIQVRSPVCVPCMFMASKTDNVVAFPFCYELTSLSLGESCTAP